MDFTWMPYFSGFWIIALFCLVFMAVMMIVCRGMQRRCCCGARSGDNRATGRQGLERRCASSEVGNEQCEAMQRHIND